MKHLFLFALLIFLTLFLFVCFEGIIVVYVMMSVVRGHDNLGNFGYNYVQWRQLTPWGVKPAMKNKNEK